MSGGDDHAPARHGASGPLNPECPRCGYALVGVTGGWDEQCPMRGRCSECGLDFAWGDVLNPRFALPTWCIEYGTLASLPRRVFATPLMTLRPWRFWRELKMVHPPRWGRIALYLAIAMPVLWYVIFAMSMGVASYRFQTQLEPVERLIASAHVALVPWSRTPLRSRSVGGLVVRDLAARYNPVDIIGLGWRATRIGSRGLLEDNRTRITEALFRCLLMMMASPIAFALLPFSRRIARVKWSHIMRIWCYGWIIALLPIGFDCLNTIERYLTIQRAFRSGVRLSGEVGVLFMILTCALVGAWWAFASGRYLRMPHAWAIGATVVVMGYLLQRLALETVDFMLVILG